MQMNFNALYFIMWLIPVMAVFCFDNVLFVWCLMEMQMMCYSCSVNMKAFKGGFLMSFVIIQLLVGLFVLFFSFLTNIYISQEGVSMMLLTLSLFMKMGMYPFSSWAVKFISGLRGFDYLFFLTIMKIVPLFLCYYVESAFCLLLIALNWLYSCFVLSYHTGYKKIIFFSSIANTCIFFSLILMGMLLLSKIFLVFYFSYISILIFFLEKMGYDFIFSGKKPNSSILLLLLILSLAGMPFLWGFVIKMLVSASLYYPGSISFFVFLFIVSVVFSFFYLKLMFFYFLSNNKWISFFSFVFVNEKNIFYYLFLIMLPFFSLSSFMLGSVIFL